MPTLHLSTSGFVLQTIAGPRCYHRVTLYAIQRYHAILLVVMSVGESHRLFRHIEVSLRVIGTHCQRTMMFPLFSMRPRTGPLSPLLLSLGCHRLFRAYLGHRAWLPSCSAGRTQTHSLLHNKHGSIACPSLLLVRTYRTCIIRLFELAHLFSGIPYKIPLDLFVRVSSRFPELGT